MWAKSTMSSLWLWLIGRVFQARNPREVTRKTPHRNSIDQIFFQVLIKANLTPFDLRRRSSPSLTLPSPRGAVGSLCVNARFFLHIVMRARHQIIILVLLNPFVQRRNANPQIRRNLRSSLSSILRIDCRAVISPLVVAMRTASRLNSSLYLGAISCLLHCEYRLKETGTKSGQDQFGP